MPGLQSTLTPRVRFAYYAKKRSKSLTAGPGWRACFQLLRVHDGSLMITESSNVLRPGVAAIVDPGTAIEASPGARYGRVVFDLVPRPVDESNEHWERQPMWETLFGKPCPNALTPAFTASWDHRIHHLITARLRDPIYHLQANMLLGTLIADCLQRSRTHRNSKQKKPPRSIPPAVIELEKLLRLGMDTGMTIKSATQQLGYDPAYVSRLYREVRGRTISDFLRTARVERACRLMEEEPDVALADVARALGLQSTRSLQRCFVRELGVAPGAWRRRRTLA